MTAHLRASRLKFSEYCSSRHRPERQGEVTIRNQEVANLLERIADILEIKGDSPYRIGAYRTAAQRIGTMAEDISEVQKRGRLREIPGVGESIAAKIDEYLRTGRLRYYEELRQQVAPGLTSLLEVPGIGARRAELIHRELGVSSVPELIEAARQHRLSTLPGIRKKMEEKILREAERVQQRTRRILLGVALPAAEEVVNLLKGHPAVLRADPAGSIRRMKETIGDIDILIASDKPQQVMDAVASFPIVKEVLAKGPTKTSVLVSGDLQIDVRVIKPEEYGSALQYFTGNKSHNIALRELAIRKGLKISEYGIFDAKTGKRLGGEREEDIYRIMGMQTPPPELREDRGEIEAALRGALPRLVELKDIRSDLHTHTNWTDGVDPPERMIEAAIERGYEYMAITDHSQGLGIARGLSPEDIVRQRRLVDKLNERYAPFRILHGIEVNIRSDGSLDYGDDVMRQFDIVTASIHGGFAQPIQKMTERIIRAIRSPYVDVIGHATGRLIGKRGPYAVDLEAVLRAAADAGVAMEINGQPDRLDLDDVWTRRAKELGVALAIDSDAHSTDQLGFMRYGVAVARRGWLEKSDVLNCLPLQKLLARLSRRRKAA